MPQQSALDLWRAKKNKKTHSDIKKMPEGVPAPLSRGQRRLWLLQELYPENPFYQYAHVYRFKGSVDIDLLLRSFQIVAQRHSVLRTLFLKTADGVFQQVDQDSKVPTEIIDLQDLSRDEQSKEIKRLTREKSTRIFKLGVELPVRVTVLRLAEEDTYVLVSMHHIVGDRWSLQILCKEWAEAYRTNTDTSSSASEIQYRDYAYRQNSQSEKPEDLEFWKKHLAGELPTLGLPTDFSRPVSPSFKGASLTKIFSSGLSERLKELAKTFNTTPFILFLSAYKTLLYRYTGQTDLTVGVPFTNRDKTVLEKLVGFFNETLVLRADLSGNPTFADLLAQLKQTGSDAFKHKNTSFDTLVRTLKPTRTGTANPLFQTMFLYNAIQKLPEFAPEVFVEEKVVDLGVSKFDLTLFITDKGEEISATFEYSTDLFAQESIERLHSHLEVLLEGIVKNPDTPIGQLPILSPSEKREILLTRNATDTEISSEGNVLEAFQEQVRLKPDSVCVSAGKKELSYAEVNAKAEAVAEVLRKKGVASNQAIGLYVGREVNLAVGIIAILKAGCAYLPLDPEYPAERIDFMLQDCGAEIILTTEDLKSNLAETQAEVLSFDEAPEHSGSTEEKHQTLQNSDTAYIIYTSGSTGKPKGVPISHQNLWTSTAARFHFYEKQAQSFLLLSSFAFDSSVAGIFWTLTQGGKLVISPQRIEQDIQKLALLIADKSITHTLMLPSLYALLLEHAPGDKLQSLQTVMVAGEACTGTVVKKHFNTLPETNLYNEYGPTEATVWCTAHKISREDAEGIIPIGRPIPNVKNYILDPEQNPVPTGVAGELYIGGTTLSTGYLNRPELSAEKFTEVELNPGDTSRLYRTGDMARYRADGVIEFLGRIDNQVKIRGFRIEPDEIKEVLLQQTGVKDAAVVVQKTGQTPRLLAFVKSNKDLSTSELRTSLKRRLPDYMVPAQIFLTDEFPHLPNGKIDKNALLQTAASAPVNTSEYDAPQSERERQLAEIWEEVLQVKPIGRNDNFFDIGGDSILSIQIVAKARQANLMLAANQLFEHQTITELARKIEEDEKGTLSVPEFEELETPEYPLSFMQQAFLLHRAQSKNDQGVLQLEFTLSGTIEIQAWEKAWQQTAERHAVLRTAIDAENALQIISPTVNLKWDYRDWTSASEEEHSKKLKEFRQADAEKELDLSQAPASRFTLIRLSKEKSLLFWTCHHILIDGWSGGIILKDALHIYQSVLQQSDSSLGKLPSYTTFLAQSDKKGKEEEHKFWAEYFRELQAPTLFNSGINQGSGPDFQDLKCSVSETVGQAIHAYARRHRVTLNTVLKGVWALVLHRYFEKDTLTFGLTVSGRNGDFPYLSEMTGLFMNVLPTRARVDKNEDFAAWLQNFQKEQTALGSFDQSTTEDIKTYTKMPKYEPLFDCLFVFGNFMKDGLEVGNISVDNFTGGFTSTYPLTVRVNPVQAVEFDFRYDENIVSKQKVKWISEQFMHLISLMTDSKAVKIGDLLATLSPPDFIEEKPATPELKSINPESENYLAPRNSTELQLTEIWEELFALSPISIRDNFFDIGGKSLLALRLFSEIEHKLDIILPPTTLLQHGTIESLAQKISGESNVEAWDTLLPLRAEGSKTPLFCIHAGGAHVFFYGGFVKYLHPDQPIYAIQPKGLDGKGQYHSSIEEMAADYIAAIQKVQPEGPFRLLGTCFSNAVCLEMAKQLDKMGLPVSMYIVDSAPAHLIPLEESKPIRRFLRILLDMNWSLLYRKLRRRVLIYKKKVTIKPLSAAQQQLQDTINTLNSLYSAYTWTPFKGKITLIRSTQFAEREGKNFHLKQWKSLAGGGLDVHVVEGKHLTFFEEPSVKGLAEKVQECLDTE